jgi:ABC-type Fe3+ transport system substrate-binding protein
MQRHLLPILFLVVLVAPFAVRLAVRDERLQGGPQAVANLPTRRLVVVTPHNRDILGEFERAFSAWHAQKYGARVEIAYILPGGTNDIVKLLDKTYAALKENGKLPPPEQIDAQTQYDMVWGGGDYTFEVEIESQHGVLQAISLPESLLGQAFPESNLAGIALYDQDDDGIHWVGVCLSAFGIVYSPFYYDRINAASGEQLPPPRTWQDLARPELANRLALADPGSSGSAAIAYMMVLQRAVADAEQAHFERGGAKGDAHYQAALDAGWQKGMGDLLIIAANARYFSDSASRVPADVSSAAAAAGVAIDFYGRVEQELAGPDRIQFVAPPAATAITPDPIAILYGTTGERLETANHFIEFLLSPQGQRLWSLKVGAPGGPTRRALRRPPIRRDVYTDQVNWTDRVNPFAEAGGFNQRQEWMGEITETRLVWQAAWIESQAALHQAYSAVLGIEDERRRGELLQELRNLPISWPDVKQLRAQRRALPKVQESVWKARTQIELAQRFREHYQRVQASASRE